MGLRADEAEEIAQKVLVRVFLYCSKTEFHHVAQVWAWVYTITVREVYKHWRRRRPELVSEEGLESLQRQAVTTDDDPATAATAAEALRAVDECIGRLGEAERLYLLGPLVQGLTFRQAAALHGLTLGQFKHRYEQALEAVRACMESKGHDLGPNPRTGGRRDD
jgi:RNA polymerase sigma factor (sigma-70 family)